MEAVAGRTPAPVPQIAAGGTPGEDPIMENMVDFETDLAAL
ncbi:hypothetical protein [Kitasatospora sp. NPDC050463]